MSRLGSTSTHTEKTLRPRKGACGCSVGCVNRGTRYGCRCFHRRVQRRKAPPSSAEATYLRQDQRSARWHALRRKYPSLGQRSLGAATAMFFYVTSGGPLAVSSEGFGLDIRAFRREFRGGRVSRGGVTPVLEIITFTKQPHTSAVLAAHVLCKLEMYDGFRGTRRPTKSSHSIPHWSALLGVVSRREGAQGATGLT